MPGCHLQAIVFHLEVPGAQGLPKPDVTYVQISGLGLEEDRNALCAKRAPRSRDGEVWDGR